MNKLFFITSIFFGFALSVSAQKQDSIKIERITFKETNPLSIKEPLVIIDGNKQYIRGTSSFKGLDPNTIESVTILKDSSAVAQYGTDGFAGVIIIKTKEGKGPVEPITPKTLPSSKIDGKELGISLRKQNPTVLLKRDSKSISLFADSLSIAKPLYIIDGKETAEADFKLINQENIASIEVLKDASSKTLYGEKAKNGVIIITTKKAKTAPKKN
ncbi:hypothetical protein DHW03_08320 [Pedobacter yonginense]|uniref:TonB-dependent receptor plug domain-containing protein n=1 Tax=Pedobacter yonginense TaxID=651869 RepID=A0A317EMF1_9SPHI|nr:TonB-dependent receptor plug domain-containing protein [Pedobacter yonginense]PWS27585.1 hypothetical protein DHW03_08320 [Pedobacter yonginense]